MTQVGIAAVNFVCGFILVIGSYVMEGLEETRDMQRWLVHVFRCVPPFNLGATLMPRIADCVCGHCVRQSDEFAPSMSLQYHSDACTVCQRAPASICPRCLPL